MLPQILPIHVYCSHRMICISNQRYQGWAAYFKMWNCHFLSKVRVQCHFYSHLFLQQFSPLQTLYIKTVFNKLSVQNASEETVTGSLEFFSHKRNGGVLLYDLVNFVKVSILSPWIIGMAFVIRAQMFEKPNAFPLIWCLWCCGSWVRPLHTWRLSTVTE